MKAAFAVWNKRIAPVFDVARDIRLVEAESGRIVRERDEKLPANSGSETGRCLIRLGVDTLVCGAISRLMLSQIAAYDIRAVSFVAGDICEIIQAWLSGDFRKEAFKCCLIAMTTIRTIANFNLMLGSLYMDNRNIEYLAFIMANNGSMIKRSMAVFTYFVLVHNCMLRVFHHLKIFVAVDVAIKAC